MGAQGSKPPKVTSHDRAVLDLKLQRDRIRQYQKKLLLVEDHERTLARTLLARGDKARALAALRRGKHQRTLVTQTDSQLQTLQELVSSIEFSQIQASVYAGLERGNEVLKELHKVLNVEKVDKLLEETAEQVAEQREVDERLAEGMTRGEEEEVQMELERLEREVREGQAVEERQREEEPTVRLPDAPRTEPVAPVREERQQERKTEAKKQEERQAVLA